MTTRTRASLTLAAILLTAIAVILLALTLLFHTLTLPAVHAADLTLQQDLHAHSTPTLTRVLLAFTWLGAIRTFAPALALAVALLLWQRRRHLAALLGLPMLGALLLNQALKLHFHRSRPQLLWSNPGQLAPAEHTFSFPSGHSLFAVVLYGTLACAALRHTRRHRLPQLALALLLILAIGISRIALGMHYPTDVLAGYLTGSLWLAATILADRTLTRTLRPHPPLDR